jgi:GNAT superfamily N-acetyltransferase
VICNPLRTLSAVGVATINLRRNTFRYFFLIFTPNRFSLGREGILELQKLADISEAEKYTVTSIPPLLQTQGEIEADDSEQIYLKAAMDDAIIGSVRVYIKDGTYFVGRLIAHPDYQNRGIGTQLPKIHQVPLQRYPRFEIFLKRKVRGIYISTRNWVIGFFKPGN